MEEISFAAPEIAEKEIQVDREYVRKQIRDVLKDQDLRRFIL